MLKLHETKYINEISEYEQQIQQLKLQNTKKEEQNVKQ
jgi:hypothetical protein